MMIPSSSASVARNSDMILFPHPMDPRSLRFGTKRKETLSEEEAKLAGLRLQGWKGYGHFPRVLKCHGICLYLDGFQEMCLIGLSCFYFCLPQGVAAFTDQNQEYHRF